MVDAFFPDTGSIFIGATIVTFKVNDFKSSGGESEPVFVRTMGRNFRRFRKPRTDYMIDMAVRIDGTTFPDFHDTYQTVGAVKLDYNGAYTATFSNCYSIGFEQDSTAVDYLKGRVTFGCAPYDSTGSSNRVIS